MKHYIPAAICFVLLLSPVLVAGQPDGGPGRTEACDDSLHQAQYGFLHHLYDSIVTTCTEDVINGSEYELYYPVYGSSPLLPKHRYPNGSIVMEGIKHSPVVLQYDTYKDLLIYFDPRHQINQSVIPVVLNKYLIDEFEVGLPENRMKFRYFEFPDSLKQVTGNGFYEVGYEGKTEYLIRYETILAITDGRYIFKMRPLKFIVNDGIIYKIKGRRSLLIALADKKNLIRKFIKSMKINVRHAGKTDMQRILSYYDHVEGQ